jgi:hypothetical protein
MQGTGARVRTPRWVLWLCTCAVCKGHMYEHMMQQWCDLRCKTFCTKTGQQPVGGVPHLLRRVAGAAPLGVRKHHDGGHQGEDATKGLHRHERSRRLRAWRVHQISGHAGAGMLGMQLLQGRGIHVRG